VLEVLDSPLVLERRAARLERAEVAAPAILRILLSRIQPVASVFEFANHCTAELRDSCPRGRILRCAVRVVPFAETHMRDTASDQIHSRQHGLRRTLLFAGLAAAWISLAAIFAKYGSELVEGELHHIDLTVRAFVLRYDTRLSH